MTQEAGDKCTPLRAASRRSPVTAAVQAMSMFLRAKQQKSVSQEAGGLGGGPNAADLPEASVYTD